MLLAITALRADESLAHARRAQLLLGAEVWSQIIRVENRAEQSRYPHTLHALVFELAGVLWFYTSVDGTQSFSLHRDRLAQEKSDFGPLLRDIEPGFARWTNVGATEGNDALAVAAADLLPNGCFIESVAALRARLLTGAPTRNPRLLSYYITTPEGRTGHTVLAYETNRGVEILDSAQPGRVFAVAGDRGRDALSLARAFDGEDVTHARTLPLARAVAAVAALTR